MTPEMSRTRVERFSRSLDRCVADSTFFSRFYARFTSASPEVAQRFRDVEMSRQEQLLRASLYYVVRAVSGFDDGVSHLESIARSHAKSGYDIRPELYRYWVEALMQVVAESDPEFDAELKSIWRETLEACVAKMTAAYVP